MDEKLNDAELEVDIEPTGEDNPVDHEMEEIEETTSNKLKALRDKLKTCEADKMEVLEQLQRTKADFLNAKKRLEEERLRDKERVIETQVEKLLPMYDSFAMAMQNTEAWEAVDKNWRVGVESIFGQLKSLLEGYGVSELNPQGETFDPSKHEALTEQTTDDKTKDHTILSVIQVGFIRKYNNSETLLRPARVVVGTFKN